MLIKKILYSVGCWLIVLWSSAQVAPTLNFGHFERKDGLTNTNTRQIMPDDKGTLFFTTQGGVFSYDGYKIKLFLTYRKQYDQKIIEGQPIGFLQAKNGNYWVATDFMGLYEYNPVMNTIKSYLTPYKDIIYRLSIDKDKTIYLATNEGLAKVQAKNGRNEIIFQQKTDKITVLNTTEQATNVLMAGTKHGVLYYLNYQNRTIDSLQTPCGEITAICNTSDNAVWIAGSKGLFLMKTLANSTHFAFTKINTAQTNLAKYGINCMITDAKNRLWIGSYGGGLLLFDTKKNIFYSYKHNKNNSKSLGSNQLIYLHGDKTGHIWIGTRKGVDVFDANIDFLKTATNGEITSQSTTVLERRLFAQLPDSLKKNRTKNTILCFQDTNGGIWWSTEQGCQLHYYHKKNNIYKPYQQPLHAVNTATGCVNAMWQDKKRRIWLAAYNGTFLYDTAKDVFINLVSIFPTIVTDNSLAGNSLIEDASGNVWCGRYEGGLDVYNLEKRQYRHFSLEDGLPDRSINSMQIDTLNRLWLATPNGLCVAKIPTSLFDTKNKEATVFFKVYNTEDGLASSNVTALFFKKDKADKFFLYVNTEEGISCIDPTQLTYNTQKPIVSFTQLRVLNKVITPDTLPASILQKPIEFTKKIVLNYDENSLSLDFSANNLQHAERNTYQYRLENYNDTWQSLSTGNTVAYTQIPPGLYRLCVKAANNDGVMSGQATTLEIEIIAAFWQTTWFKLLLISAGTGLIFFFYTNKLNQTRLEAELKQRIAEAKEQESAYQKQLSITEMSALRAQMNPHFIFNCLNSIHNFTLDNDSDNASKYLTKFARLIRLVLENSRSERVKLSNELQALQLYIEMETLRFKEKVHYEINIDDEIEPSMIQIPPMLIQPYVENAIWHGLMPKKEGGIVLINILSVNDTYLQIEIIDTGVGRKKAAALKSKNAIQHKSHGMQITSDRVQLIKQLYNIDTKIDIIDLYDDDKKSKGTKIIIKIPLLN